MATTAHQARSLYRRFLRELPQRTPSLLANPSPIQQQIRHDYFPIDQNTTTLSASNGQRDESRRMAEAEQHIQYLQAQRLYTTLIERYNPGMNMDEEEKIRLTARRVGMDLPVEADKNSKER